MREVVVRLDEAGRREFLHFLAGSAGLHVVAFLVLALAPELPSIRPPAVIPVRLVASSAVLQSTPARPRPKPPKPAPTVLPTEPTTPKTEAKPRPEEAPPRAEQDYEDVLDRLRSELGESAPEEPAAGPVQTAAVGVPGGVPVSPEVAAWLKNARIHVRRSWVVPPAFEMQTLVAEISVKLDGAGNVKGTPEVVRRSGNPWYDENVVRSIQKASPLPAPPEAGKWTFVFYSDRDA